MHPGVTVADVEAATSFEIEVAPTVETTVPPTAREIEILHKEIDPAGIVLKK
jgi:glutaconate CoA-transferase subunit B